MMTDEQKTKVAELKAAIEATATTMAGVPLDVRAEVIALKRELQREGMTSRALAAVLGVHESTLCRWGREDGVAQRAGASSARRSGGMASFRVVEVMSASATPRSAPPSVSVPACMVTPRGLRVAHAPSGLVVDGLDVETLVVLLRRMS
jgi:hypothetical protein